MSIMTEYWSQLDIDYYIKILKSNDLSEIGMFLLHYNDLRTIYPAGFCHEDEPVPISNDEIIRLLENLLDDRRPVPITSRFPRHYGELRWAVARALACEYAYRGIDKPIILKDVMKPIRSREAGRIDDLTRRIEQGLQPTQTEIIKPQDYCEWCSKEAIERLSKKQNSDET
ncbi:MAG: hypothetical protein AAFR81_15780 [Chloroflexota bacterium]